VPPSQAEMMVAALRDKKIPVAYMAFENEQHGFRSAPTIRATLAAELYFYGRIFGFEPADELEVLEIDNL
jgi:dipeptidyl aminopeptidase/acylaminoacyl peptidase